SFRAHPDCGDCTPKGARDWLTLVLPFLLDGIRPNCCRLSGRYRKCSCDRREFRAQADLVCFRQKPGQSSVFADPPASRHHRVSGQRAGQNQKSCELQGPKENRSPSQEIPRRLRRRLRSSNLALCAEATAIRFVCKSILTALSPRNRRAGTIATHTHRPSNETCCIAWASIPHVVSPGRPRAICRREPAATSSCIAALRPSTQ